MLPTSKDNNAGKIFIGTSNIVLPGNKTTFPEEFQRSSRMHYYARLFNSAELNTTFYKTPRFATFQKWEEEVGAEFRFSVKFSKAITHEKSLLIDREVLKEFMTNAAGISNKKKGCLLIQFPGKITLDYYSKVSQLLDEINNHEESVGWKKAVEFRHASWYIAETAELLQEYSATMVLHDMHKAPVFDDSVNAKFIYLRFHGPAGDYRGSYSDNFLREKADNINQWRSLGKEVYVYFNNTAGNAFENARRLQQLSEKEFF